MSGSSLKRSVQLKFQDPRLRPIKQFGGTLLKKSNAKVARPLSTKHAMHLVLRSSLATKEWSLRSLKNQKIVEKILREQSRKYGVRIYEFANVGNHLHLLIRVTNRHTFSAFIRAVSGIIAMKVTGAAKTRELKQKFWDYRPWSRVVEWKNSFSLAKDYVVQNHLEAIGFITYRPRDYQKYFQREAPA